MLAPMRTLPNVVGVLVASALLVSSCTSAESAETTTTTTLAPVTTIATTTTTTAPPTTTTTTTTIPEPEVSAAINGLPAEDDLVDRRVVAVKIDNHPNARPQSGLDVADAVYEVLVEAGLTRFIALFHQSDADHVGPNRSGRPTDSQVMGQMAGGPMVGLIGNLHSIRAALTTSAVLLTPTIPLFGRTIKKENKIKNSESLE